MHSGYASDEIFPSWQPEELGVTRAAGLSILLVVVIVSFCVWTSTAWGPKPQPPVIQITQAQEVQLPAPTPPPPPPKVIPPPKPLPALIPKPMAVPSKIVVATKPPPPRHVYKPIPHPVAPHPPAPVVTHQPPAPQAAAPRTDGEPIYGSEMHNILEANQSVPPALAQLGISGTAVVHIMVAPDGHVVSARIITSGGNPLIDQTALDHALHAKFAAFNANMPNQILGFDIPIDIEPDSDGN